MMEEIQKIVPFSFGLGTLLFGAILVSLPLLLSPRGKGRFRDETYESGEPIIGEAWVQFRGYYYMYALIFVAFDVETAFIVPCVTVLRSYGSWLPVIEVAVFLIVLSLSLVYALKKKVLHWT
jgi:NADH-quinone oxidoreductase subunit A